MNEGVNKEEDGMSIKMKLGLGVASAALGFSLIGGGTWAAFNDTATINNHFAAGTLDLVVGKVNAAANFDLKNMKPGDSVKRVFTLNNAGTLAIKQVLLNTTADSFKDNGTPSTSRDKLHDYLSQFKVDVMSIDSENSTGIFEPRTSLLKPNVTLTLKDLVDGGYRDKIQSDYLVADGRINLASLVSPTGIPVTPADIDPVLIKITFVNDLTKADGDQYGEYVQNKFQNDSANFYFNLEATQWSGRTLDSSNGNGVVNNGVPGSADGTNDPNPRTINPTNREHGTNEVTDGDNRD
jgi:spore coat-associated protein N